MRIPIGIPIIVKNVKLTGPAGSVCIDMILDTGAAITTISWADLKIVAPPCASKSKINLKGINAKSQLRIFNL